jgi:hypothetical protein
MSNNKQSSVEWFSNQTYELFEQYSEGNFDRITLNKLVLKATEQAKAQHKKETIDFALHCMMPKLNPDKSTIEVVSDIYDEVFGGNNEQQ